MASVDLPLTRPRGPVGVLELGGFCTRLLICSMYAKSRVCVLALLVLLGACSDSSDRTAAPVPIVRVPPVVEAGADLTVLGGSRVLLQGSGFVSDGAPLSYHWRQDAGPPVVIDDPGSPNAAFFAPRDTAELTLKLRLAVTDAAGATAMDVMTVRVLPPGGLLLSPTRGHTGTLGATARFGVRLRNPPIAAVRIPLWSSDEGEGRPTKQALEFTPGNWNRWQSVAVQGTNVDIQGGRQDYWLRLGMIDSVDPAYSGLDPEDVHMRGLFLEIDVPSPPQPSLPGMVARFQARTSYSGHAVLSHALVDAPSEARIDLTTGEISWTPGEEDEGGVFDFTVRVTDNGLFATTRFQVQVARPRPLPVVGDAASSSLAVAGSGTNLDGLQIHRAERDAGLVRSHKSATLDLNTVSLEIVPPADAPKIPQHIDRLSEILFVRGGSGEAVTLLFPLPVPLDAAQEVTLYAYGEAVDAQHPFWIPIGLPKRIVDCSAGKCLQITLPRIAGALFVGRSGSRSADGAAHATGRSQPFGASSLVRQTGLVSRADPGAVTCVADPALGGDNQVCTSTEDPGLEVRVRGFGEPGSGTTKWGVNARVRVEEMISWIVDARIGATELGMSFDDSIFVSAEYSQEDDPDIVTLGYVSPVEDYRVLHLNDALGIPVAIMQATTVHELFHHAQSRTGAEEMQIIRQIAGRNSTWVIEGTAVWFEDFVYDDINFYDPGPAILSAGLNGGLPGFISDDPRNPYYRNLFFYLLSGSCTGFRNGVFPNILVTDPASDPNGLQKLRTEIQKQDYACDFGAHLGEDRASSLEAALSYYQYATQFRNMVSLLDAGAERLDGGFEVPDPEGNFVSPAQGAVDACADAPSTTRCLQTDVTSIPPAGAYSFYVPEYSLQNENQRPALQVEAGNQNIVVSITSAQDSFVGDNRIGVHEHSWFETSERDSLVYDFAGQRPSFFVTLVNPSATSAAPLDSVRIVLEDVQEGEDTEAIELSGLADNADSSERVINVNGTVPASLQGQVSAVAVRSGSINVRAEVDGQGRFNARIVLLIGTNFIWLKMLDSSGNKVGSVQRMRVRGVADGGNGARNVLVPSRAVFILGWDQPGVDFDIYSTDGSGTTLWWDGASADPGFLDFDVRTGYGPEVITYRSTGSSSRYAGETFKIDVHYFEGAIPTEYTLDLILNEGEPANRRRLRYSSITSISRASTERGVHGPSGSGSSRHNDVLTIGCDNSGVCSVEAVDGTYVELVR